jgi:hypothetical protein
VVPAGMGTFSSVQCGTPLAQRGSMVCIVLSFTVAPPSSSFPFPLSPFPSPARMLDRCPIARCNVVLRMLVCQVKYGRQGYKWGTTMTGLAYSKSKSWTFSSATFLLFVGSPLIMAYIAREKMAQITAFAAIMDEQNGGNPFGDGGAGGVNPMQDPMAAVPAKSA